MSSRPIGIPARRARTVAGRSDAAARPSPIRVEARSPAAVLGRLVLLAVPLILIGVETLAVNRSGIAVTPDSAHYLSAAGNLARGRGLIITQIEPDTRGAAIPYTAWPPLYPALVAAGVRCRLGLFESAALVNAAGLLLAVLCAAAMARRCLGGPASFVAALAVAWLPGLLFVAAFAWSEPAFIGFTFLFLWALARALPEREAGREWEFLVIAGGAGALAAATRYFGVGVALAGGVALLVYHSGRPLRRLAARTAVVVAPALLFTAAWASRNEALTGTVAGQPRLSPHFDLPEIVGAMGSATLRDLTGGWAVNPPVLGVPAATVARAAAALGALLVLLALGTRILRARYERVEPSAPLLLPLAAFALLYTMAVALVGSRVHQLDPPGTRFLAPIYPALVLLAALGVRLGVDPGPGIGALSPLRRRALAIGLLLVVAPLAAGSATFIGADAGAPDGRLPPYWRTRVWARPWPDGAAALARLKGDREIWTNVPEYVDLVGGRIARRLPLHGEERAWAMVASRPGRAILLDTRFTRGRLTRSDFLEAAARPQPPVVFLGDVGQASLFRVAAGGAP